MDTKEAVALTEKWLNEIKNVTVNYYNSIGILKKAREDYENQTKKWYSYVLPYVSPIIVIIILLIAFGVMLHASSCPNPITIKFEGLELTQHCR